MTTIDYLIIFAQEHLGPIRADASSSRQQEDLVNRRRDEDLEQRSRTTWRKSSFSNGTGGDCVEVALVDGTDHKTLGTAHKPGMGPLIALRDSKDPDGPKLYFTRSEFAAFRHGLMAGEFDDLI
ncbi:DUF397 domain-containing protein [Nonomuraea sp. NPDC052129]|uniref:DUF397 domain-containing protein n=1 Tax=Nonomuraea sp. NPDC052129 TaxID=3154651 RepID=UPI003443ED56